MCFFGVFDSNFYCHDIMPNSSIARVMHTWNCIKSSPFHRNARSSISMLNCWNSVDNAVMGISRNEIHALGFLTGNDMISHGNNKL